MKLFELTHLYSGHRISEEQEQKKEEYASDVALKFRPVSPEIVEHESEQKSDNNVSREPQLCHRLKKM